MTLAYIGLATTGHKTTPSSKGRRKSSFLAGCIPALKRNEDFVERKESGYSVGN